MECLLAEWGKLSLIGLGVWIGAPLGFLIASVFSMAD